MFYLGIKNERRPPPARTLRTKPDARACRGHGTDLREQPVAVRAFLTASSPQKQLHWLRTSHGHSRAFPVPGPGGTDVVD